MFKLASHQTFLLSELQCQRKKPSPHAKIYCNIELILNNKQTIYAHKCILAAQSRYFDKLINDHSDSKVLELELDLLLPEIAKAMIDLCYTGELDCTKLDRKKLRDGLKLFDFRCLKIVDVEKFYDDLEREKPLVIAPKVEVIQVKNSGDQQSLNQNIVQIQGQTNSQHNGKNNTQNKGQHILQNIGQNLTQNITQNPSQKSVLLKNLQLFQNYKNLQQNDQILKCLQGLANIPKQDENSEAPSKNINNAVTSNLSSDLASSLLLKLDTANSTNSTIINTNTTNSSKNESSFQKPTLLEISNQLSTFPGKLPTLPALPLPTLPSSSLSSQTNTLSTSLPYHSTNNPLKRFHNQISSALETQILTKLGITCIDLQEKVKDQDIDLSVLSQTEKQEFAKIRRRERSKATARTYRKNKKERLKLEQEELCSLQEENRLKIDQLEELAKVLEEKVGEMADKGEDRECEELSAENSRVLTDVYEFLGKLREEEIALQLKKDEEMMEIELSEQDEQNEQNEQDEQIEQSEQIDQNEPNEPNEQHEPNQQHEQNQQNKQNEQNEQNKQNVQIDDQNKINHEITPKVPEFIENLEI